MISARPRKPRVPDVDPDGRHDRDGQRRRPRGWIRIAEQDGEDRPDDQEHVPAHAEHGVREPVPRSVRERSHRSHATPSRPVTVRPSDHSQRNPAPRRSADHGEDRHREKRDELRPDAHPGVLQSLDAWRGVLADLDQDVGEGGARDIDAAQEHHREEQRDRHGRRDTSGRRDGRQQQANHEERRGAEHERREVAHDVDAESGTSNATRATTMSRRGRPRRSRGR